MGQKCWVCIRVTTINLLRHTGMRKNEENRELEAGYSKSGKKTSIVENKGNLFRWSSNLSNFDIGKSSIIFLIFISSPDRSVKIVRECKKNCFLGGVRVRV